MEIILTKGQGKKALARKYQFLLSFCPHFTREGISPRVLKFRRNASRQLFLLHVFRCDGGKAIALKIPQIYLLPSASAGLSPAWLRPRLQVVVERATTALPILVVFR